VKSMVAPLMAVCWPARKMWIRRMGAMFGGRATPVFCPGAEFEAPLPRQAAQIAS